MRLEKRPLSPSPGDADALHVLPFEVRDGRHNMAVDEALLRSEGPPTLRCYGWNPPTLSLGYFQGRRRGEEPAEHLLEAGLPVVRRMTGGGAIVHWHELTYSVVLPLDHPWIDGLATDASYRRIHEPVVAVLQRLGVPVSQRTEDDPGGHAALCFDRTTSLDLEAGGRKLVGSAQRRARGRVLHHGSIILRRNHLQPGTAAVEDFVSPMPEPADLAERLAEAFRLAVASV